MLLQRFSRSAYDKMGSIQSGLPVSPIHFTEWWIQLRMESSRHIKSDEPAAIPP